MKALLIAGDARFFLDRTRGFKKYLENEVELKDVQLFKTGYMTLKHIWTSLRKALDPTKANGPLLLLYCGHGAEDGWGVSFCNTLLYRPLVQELLKDYPEPIVFVNDCCYAATPIKWFRQFVIPSSRMSFIAAGGSREEVQPGLIARVKQSWQEHKIHKPLTRNVSVVEPGKPITDVKRATPEVRFGSRFDHFFFSKVPRPSAKAPILKGKLKKELVEVSPDWIIRDVPAH